MSDKLYQYEGTYGILRNVKERTKEKFDEWREDNSCFPISNLCKEDVKDYSHIYRKKTRKELLRLSAAVMGIEFSYAAETAFVSPTLLKIGVRHQLMTMIWGLSPMIGFFVTPLLGSLSDRCRYQIGRRRPFIILTSIGVLLGLILVPNGSLFGSLFGDYDCEINKTLDIKNVSIKTEIDNSDCGSKFWSILFTIIGTVLLDFDADACQSPSRAYLLDVTLPEDHARGLSTFTIMAGLGGGLGYILGAINWDDTAIGHLFGGHVRAVFSLITIIFILSITYTLTSFAEIPLTELERLQINQMELRRVSNPKLDEKLDNYEMFNESVLNASSPIKDTEKITLLTYLKSIIIMPNSLKILCLTNLFCWMSHVCYSLYFTDFVGEAVFGGNPKALEGSTERELYEEGVRFGCWGMAMYSFSCAIYSTFIEKLIQLYKAKKVYVSGMLIYGLGMLCMCASNNKVAVIIFSASAGVMYSTLFTMPYLIVAHYHSCKMFGNDQDDQIRGLGTDIAIVSSMVFLAQFILSLCMGSIITIAGTTSAVIFVASILGFCGAFTGTKILYLDL